MSRSRSRQRLGLLAIAFDTSGRGVLDALAARPDLAEAQIHCYHMAATEDGQPPAWYHKAGEQGWEAVNGAPGQAEPVQALEAAVRTALDVDRWLTADGGIDLLDIVLLSPASDLRPAPLPPSVLEALRRIRRRFYQRIARIFLLVDGSFETLGESATRGLIRPLPFADGSDQGIFDLIVLLDRLNLAGMVMNDGSEAMRHAAGVLSLLTASGMSALLYQRIQGEQARTGSHGRYVAIGLTEWRLEERAVEATSEILYRQMAALISGKPLPSPAGAEFPADPWLDRVAAEVLQTSEKEIDPMSAAAVLEAEGREALLSLFRASGWAVPMLVRLLDRRVGEIEKIAAQARTRLASFMISRFAEWYVRHKTGQGQAGGQPTVFETKKPRHDRVILCAVAAVLCATGIGIALATSYSTVGWIVAALSGLGAIAVALQGFEETEKHFVDSPPPPDLRPELRRLRSLAWLGREMSRRTRRAAKLCHDNVAHLGAEAGMPLQDDPKSFPFSLEVCTALLERKEVWPRDCLRQLWEDQTAFERTIEGNTANLEELLREHARRSCTSMSGLSWSDIFLVSSGPASSDGIFWREALETARAGSIPWIPVSGTSEQTFLALPRNLTDEARNLLVERFPAQKTVEEIDGNEIFVVQLSQGYREETS